jgi:hypothetical protein
MLLLLHDAHCVRPSTSEFSKSIAVPLTARLLRVSPQVDFH